MRRWITAVGVVVATTLCSCSQRVDLELYRSVASVAPLSEQTTELLLADFMPAVEGLILSAEQQEGLSISYDGGVVEVVNIDAPVLGLLRFAREEQPVDILYMVKPMESVSPSLKLFTVESKDRRLINVGFTERPDKVIALWQNRAVGCDLVEMYSDNVEVTIPAFAESMERSYIRVYASKGNSIYSDVLIPLQWGRVVDSTDDITRHDPHAQVIYSLMIDRFENGNSENDRPLNHPDVLPIVDYMGGDLEGITQRIKSSFFTDLGISTIWLSPITQNPYDAWGLNENPHTKFSGYHGYWPIYTTVIDERFGTDEELRELLDEAHSRGINVILDYVANHLHIDSPVLQQNPDWVTPGVLPDGRENIALWDEQRLTTWFDKHIPTLDLEREEVVKPMTDSALYWLANYNFDGFRHDASKHIPEGYWRMLTTKMKNRFPDRSIYQIGETYGSPELIGSYVRSGMMDAQFDFNVYDRATWTFGGESGDFNDLISELQRSHATYGAHNVMGYISGNHDRPRFISLAGGSLTWDEDHKVAGWTRNVDVGGNDSYQRSLMLNAFMLTIPGVPTIYQGDEYGVPGGNDPDNRHMMQFEGYKIEEQRNRDAVAELANYRHGSMPLIYGDMLPLYTSADIVAFARIYRGEAVVVAFNKSHESASIEVELPRNVTPLQGVAIGDGQVNGSTIELPAMSYVLFTNR